MATLEERRAGNPLPGFFIPALVIITLAVLVTLGAIPALALADLPLWLSPAIAMAVALGCVAVWNTHYGLCFVAFAIAPLGFIERQVAFATFNLPEVLILALAVKEAIRFAVGREKPVPFLPARTLAFYIAAALLGLATALLRGNGAKDALQDFRQYNEFILLYLLVLQRVTARRQILQILACFLVGMSLVGLHGIIQRFTGWGVPAYIAMSDEIYHHGIRSASFYGATPLGGMMVFALGTAAGLGLSSRSRVWQTAIAGAACLCLTAAVFTKTRASWLAIVIVCAFIFLSIRRTKIAWTATVLSLLLFAGILGPLVIERMETLEVSKKERSLLERVRYYTAAWYIFEAYPVLGLGWGCEFSVDDIIINGRYVPPPPREVVYDKRRAILNKSLLGRSTVHSAYLQVLARTGIVGLAALLLFLGQWLARVRRVRVDADRSQIDYNLFIGVSAGVIGYLCHSGLENFFQWPVMSQSFWLLLGLTTVMAARLSQRSTPDAPTPEPPPAEA